MPREQSRVEICLCSLVKGMRIIPHRQVHVSGGSKFCQIDSIITIYVENIQKIGNNQCHTLLQYKTVLIAKNNCLRKVTNLYPFINHCCVCFFFLLCETDVHST